MLYFLYGPDSYRSRQKLNEIIDSYKKIHKSGLNFYIIDACENDFEELKIIIESFSMFREKKLVVLKELFLNKVFLKKTEDYLKKNDFSKDIDIMIVIYEKEIDKKSPLFIFLKKAAKTQEFSNLSGMHLKKWFGDELKNRGLDFESEAAEKFLIYTGNDLWHISNELAKIANFKKNQKINEKDIDILVRSKSESDIFQIIDVLSSKNKKSALNLLSRYFDSGDDPLYLLAMIEYQFRNLLKIKSNTENMKIFQVNDLAKKLGMHPYVARKSFEQAKKFDLPSLKKIYEKLFELDFKIKSGQIEPVLGIQMLTLEICGK